MTAAPRVLALFLAASCGSAQNTSPSVILRFAGDFQGSRLSDALVWAFRLERRHLVMPDSLEKTTGRFFAEAGKRDAFRQELIERYALVYHWETRTEDAWVLRLPGNPGPELKKVDESQSGGSPRTGDSFTHSWAMCQPCGFAALARQLSWKMDAEVRDETGLAGLYEFTLKWPKGDVDAMVREFMDKLAVEASRVSKPVQVLVIDAASVRAGESPPAPNPAWACEPSAAVRAALEALPRIDDYSLSRDRRMAPRWELARRYPADPFVQMQVQDAFSSHSHLACEWDRAIAGYRALGDAIYGPFFEGRLLAATEREQAVAGLRRVLEFAPDFPWAHLELGRWAAQHNDPASAENHLRAFCRVCPESLAALPLLRAARDPALLREAGETLFRKAAYRADAAALAARPHLWALMLRNGRDVSRDLAFVRMLNRFADPDWVAAVQSGYELTGDQGGHRAFGDAVLAGAPSGAPAYRIVRDRWFHEHPFPQRDEAQQRTWAASMAGAFREWKARWPDLPEVDRDRWTGLRATPWPPASEALAAVAALYETARKHPEFGASVPPLAIEYAGLLLSAGAAKGRTGALVEEGLRQAEEQEKYRRGGSQHANVELAKRRAQAALGK